MAKYSFEFKKQIIHEYLSSKGGYDFLAQKYGIPQGKITRNLINNYKWLFKRTEGTAFRGKSTSEKTARIMHSLLGEFKLKDILAVVSFPKASNWNRFWLPIYKNFSFW